MESKELDDYLVDIVNAAHRGKVKNWGHGGCSGTFGDIGFIIEDGNSLWRRSKITFSILATDGSLPRDIGTVEVRHSSAQGRLIERIVELGKVALAAEFSQKVNMANQSSGCSCGGACPCNAKSEAPEGPGVA